MRWEKEEAFWRRLRRVEEERDQQNEEERASRWKHLFVSEPAKYLGVMKISNGSTLRNEFLSARVPTYEVATADRLRFVRRRRFLLTTLLYLACPYFTV